ncbi:MAG: exodeoxyribonuclease VII large subunit [Acidobacteria bacterium]|nr:exodeoxyribonuclease VII large subunit [Acidobacteriota bacterium]
MEQLTFGEERAVHTVTSLTAAIHRLISLNFEDVRVSGEISGFKVWSSGHAYFTLKDAGAQIRCVMFKSALRYLKFKPGDGLAVTARGSVEVRQERGEYQLLISSMEPQGLGALQLAFEQLKRKLAEEGLFENERKRALPPFPRRIGIVTSPKGAVIRDMIHVLGRRFPGLHIRLYPTLVQGEGSVEGVCEGLRYFSESGWADVVIVGRGGGSLEDLWTFNEEAVARAIAECSVPVVSAVGHETDFTIADFVADLRAPTPSAAAEVVVPNRADLLEMVRVGMVRVERGARYHLAAAGRRLHEKGIDRATMLVRRQAGLAWQKVDELEQRLRRLDPRVRLAAARQRLVEAEHAMGRLAGARVRAAELRVVQLGARSESLVRGRVSAVGRKVESLAAGLSALSPVAVLERGYSVLSVGEKVVRGPEDAPVGTEVEARLARGKLRARVI